MGNRANIEIQQEYSTGSIFLYTHWGGVEKTQKTVARTLREMRGRWTDESYLIRGMFNRLTEGQEMEETGFGISTEMTDEENPRVVVSMKKQCVTIDSEVWTFEKFSKKFK